MMKRIILFLTVTVSYPLYCQSQDDNFVNKVSFIGNNVLKKSDLLNQLELKPSSLSLFSKPIALYMPSMDKKSKDLAPIYSQISSLVLLTIE